MLLTRLVQSLTAPACVAALGCSATPTPPRTEPTSGEAGASWADLAVARIRVDTGDAGGMRGCTGTLTPEAKAFFAKVYTEASKCAAAGPSPIKGSVSFHSTLEEGGGLSEFAVIEDKLGDPSVTQCIQEKAVSIEFPKVDAKTPCVQLVHPMTFP